MKILSDQELPNEVVKYTELCLPIFPQDGAVQVRLHVLKRSVANENVWTQSPTEVCFSERKCLLRMILCSHLILISSSQVSLLSNTLANCEQGQNQVVLKERTFIDTFWVGIDSLCLSLPLLGVSSFLRVRHTPNSDALTDKRASASTNK